MAGLPLLTERYQEMLRGLMSQEDFRFHIPWNAQDPSLHLAHIYKATA
jgi:hypothetical protein